MSKSKKSAKAEAGRRLFLVDIENFCNKPVLGEGDVREARQRLEELCAPGASDLVVVGTTHTSNLAAASFGWQGARQVWQPNRDGADLALIRAAGDYRIDSFSEVVVVSGDGIFASKVSELARQAAVTVVTRMQSASRALIRCAPRVVYA